MTTRRRRNALNATGGRKVETMNKEPHSINKLVITKTCFQQFTMYMRDWIGTLMDSITISLSRSSTWETSICIAEMQIYLSVRACVHACMCACVCGCVCACICMFMFVFVCIHIYMCVCKWGFVCVYVCMRYRCAFISFVAGMSGFFVLKNVSSFHDICISKWMIQPVYMYAHLFAG